MDGISATQETLRKYTKPTYTKKQPQWRPMARQKDDVENGRRKMGIVKLCQVAQVRDRWRLATREVLILLG
jgi:hypothetical protein